MTTDKKPWAVLSGSTDLREPIAKKRATKAHPAVEEAIAAKAVDPKLLAFLVAAYGFLNAKARHRDVWLDELRDSFAELPEHLVEAMGAEAVKREAARDGSQS